MQALHQISQKTSLECFSLCWGFSSFRHQKEKKRLFVFSGGSRIKAFDVKNKEKINPIELQFLLPHENVICMLAPCHLKRMQNEFFPLVAVGTVEGHVLLLTLKEENIGALLKTEKWSVAAESNKTHAAPVDFGAWNSEASFLATAAADGSIAIWKRQGFSCVASFKLKEEKNFEEKKENFGGKISALCFDYSGDYLLIACGEKINIIQLNWGLNSAEKKTEKEKNLIKLFSSWKAHAGGVTHADWGKEGFNLIVSIGFDFKCCFWDFNNGALIRCMQTDQLIPAPKEETDFLGLLFQPNYPTAVKWNPKKNLILIAFSRFLAVCTPQGHVLDVHLIDEADFILGLDWSPDGREIAVACGFSGFFIFEFFAKKRICWKYSTLLIDRNSVELQNYFEESQRQISFKDPIVDFAQSPECVAIITKKQCIIIPTQDFFGNMNFSFFSLNAPKEPKQIFVGISCVCYTDESSLHVLSLSAVIVCSISLPLDVGNKIKASCNNDFIVLLKGRWMQKVQFFDARNGKTLGDYFHSCEIKKIELNQVLNGGKTFASILDVTGCLLVADANRPTVWQEISISVNCMRWIWGFSCLIGIQKNKLFLWFMEKETNVSFSSSLQYPQVLNTNISKEACEIISAEKEGIQILHLNGKIKRFFLSPLFLQFAEELKKQNWKTCVNLCVMEDKESLWAAFARAALNNQDFAFAAIAFAALKDFPRLQLSLKSLEKSSFELKQNIFLFLIFGTLRNLREAANVFRRFGKNDKCVKFCMKNYLWQEAISFCEGTSFTKEKIEENRRNSLQLLSGSFGALVDGKTHAKKEKEDLLFMKKSDLNQMKKEIISTP